MAIEKGQFIELDYTGRLEDGTVFDTTSKAVAEQAGLNPKAEYKPVIICIGEGQILPGLDEFLKGKELGKHTCSLQAAQAFGKKDAKLLKLIPLNKFKKAKIEPFPGLEVNIDGHYGIVRSVSGGRVTVDFNHPLAGKDVTYDLDAKRVVEDKVEQVAALLEMTGLHHHGVTMEQEDHVVINVHDPLPQPVAESINALITRLIAVKTVSYHVDASGHHH